ncbi:hypothetical protein Avbf_09837, partial [Armadillidium vulgare]
ERNCYEFIDMKNEIEIKEESFVIEEEETANDQLSDRICELDQKRSSPSSCFVPVTSRSARISEGNPVVVTSEYALIGIYHITTLVCMLQCSSTIALYPAKLFVPLESGIVEISPTTHLVEVKVWVLAAFKPFMACLLFSRDFVTLSSEFCPLLSQGKEEQTPDF